MSGKVITDGVRLRIPIGIDGLMLPELINLLERYRPIFLNQSIAHKEYAICQDDQKGFVNPFWAQHSLVKGKLFRHGELLRSPQRRPAAQYMPVHSDDCGV